jgi:hypothetical protein
VQDSLVAVKRVKLTHLEQGLGGSGDGCALEQPS